MALTTVPFTREALGPAYDPNLLGNVMTELWNLQAAHEANPGTNADPNADMVWVLSAPGTYYEAPNDGAYSGQSFDRLNIIEGVRAVRDITAARMETDAGSVTKSDIARHGPKLFYNGEDAQTKDVNYLQNEALERAIATDDFPLPKSNVVIDRIDTIGTPAQMTGFAEYSHKVVEAGGTPAKKIAVVSLFAHSARVGRYLQLHLNNGSFAGNPKFTSVPVFEGNSWEAVHREVWKIMNYYPLGHMARESAFASS